MGRAALVALALALGACASKPPIILGERMPAGCTKKTTNERCIGWILDRVLMRVLWKPYDDEAIRQYVEEVGLRLAKASGENRRWTFRVIEDSNPQAYSGFNSTIYLTRGVIGILRDEAELASIIAHEMAHTVSGHNRESLMDYNRDAALSEVAQWRDRRYARDDEIQADELAVIMLSRAGYDVHAFERMMRALGAGDDDEDASDNRHPIFRERIARAVALASRYPEGERGEERFNARVAKLVVGEDPRHVTVLDNVVMFARGNVALDLPADAKWFRWGGMVIAGYDKDEVFATIQLIDKNLVEDIKNEKPDTFTVAKVFGDYALSITVLQDDEKPTRDLAAEASKLVGRLRAPRKAELARLYPMRFDPTMPRPLWNN